MQSQQPPQYEAHVELGGGVSAVAEVPDCSTIYVAVGLGFHVECRLHEVARIVALQRGPLQQRLADLRANTAPLQEQIEYAEVTLESLRGTLPP